MHDWMDDLPEFWAEVEKIGWVTKTENTDEVKARLLREWPKEKTVRMRAVFRALMARLYTTLGGVSGVSDDGFSDLRAHIIGLGKVEYERVLYDPDLAQQRANKNAYTESFSYCLPYETDYPKEA